MNWQHNSISSMDCVNIMIVNPISSLCQGMVTMHVKLGLFIDGSWRGRGGRGAARSRHGGREQLRARRGQGALRRQRRSGTGREGGSEGMHGFMNVKLAQVVV